MISLETFKIIVKNKEKKRFSELFKKQRILLIEIIIQNFQLNISFI